MSYLSKDEHINIIVYRRDNNPKDAQQITGKFISTSATTKGAFTGRPNVVIVVPRGSNGAYIEQLSDKRYRRQREFLLGKNVELKQISIHDGVVYYKVVEERA